MSYITFAHNQSHASIRLSLETLLKIENRSQINTVGKNNLIFMQQIQAIEEEKKTFLWLG